MIDRNLCKREAARTRYITGEIFENDLTLGNQKRDGLVGKPASSLGFTDSGVDSL